MAKSDDQRQRRAEESANQRSTEGERRKAEAFAKGAEASAAVMATATMAERVEASYEANLAVIRFLNVLPNSVPMGGDAETARLDVIEALEGVNTFLAQDLQTFRPSVPEEDDVVDPGAREEGEKP